MKDIRLLLIGLLAVAALIFLAQGQTAHAATITVNTTDDELNSDSDCSLREAIQAANTDTAVDACTAGSGADTIDLPAGTYTLSIVGAGENANTSGDLDIASDLTITGAGAATTTVDGAALDRVFHILAVTSEISGVTIQNGSAGSGGGIFNTGTLTLNSSTVSGNTGTNGGGMLNFGGTLTVNDSTVSGNTAQTGGGIRNEGTATLTNVTVSGNTATSFGGGIENGENGATLTVTGSTVSGNTAGGEGGGIRNVGGGTASLTNVSVSGNSALVGGGISNGATLTLTSTTVSANTATFGGGIHNADTATLIDSTVSDNFTGGSGGGILNSGGTLSITGSTVSDNTAGAGGGGGIGSVDGTLILADSTVSGNTTPSFGGGISSIFGTMTLTSSTVSDNTAGSGGGIRNGGTATLTNVTVSGNNTAGFGGGIFSQGTLTLNSSTVSGNMAVAGGGMHSQGTLTLNGSTISGNTTTAEGGGIRNQGGTATLTNSTISGNAAGADRGGGGIVNFNEATLILESSTVSANMAGAGGGIFNEGSVILKNAIMANNIGGDCFGGIISDGHNLDSDGTCGLGAAGDLPNTNSQLGPLADNGGPTQTHALLPGSPAIDAGSGDCPPPATDQRGLARPQGAACDIGAFELVLVIAVDIDIKPGSDPNCIKADGKGRVPVALLSDSAVLNLNDVDTSTVALENEDGTLSVSPVRVGSNKDVGGDPDPDLVFFFQTAALNGAGLLTDGAVLFLRGELQDGAAFEGSDQVFVAGGPNCFD